MIKFLYKKITGNEIDQKVSRMTLFEYCFSKFLALLIGFIKTRKYGVFCCLNSKIRYNSLIKYGKILNISNNVYLNALSRNGIWFGNYVSIGCYTRIECSGSLTYLGQGFKCGNNCGLGTNSFYGAAGGIVIGNDVIVGNFVSMHSENHNYSNKDIPIRLQGVHHKGIFIGDNCWIGAKATILDGTRIGNGCVIAAGAVVTGEFPDNVVIGGVPAKIIKNR